MCDIFESDKDLDPKTAYICYSDRWLLELVFNRYKNGLGLDRTCVQGDFSVIGLEFINFIATVLTCRMLRKATAAGLLETRSYGDLLEDLSEVWRDVNAPDHAATNDGHWVHTMEYEFAELEALGLSEPVPKNLNQRNRASHAKIRFRRINPNAAGDGQGSTRSQMTGPADAGL